MKRLWVSLVLLVVIVSIGVWTLYTQQHIAEEWLGYIRRMEQAYKEQEIAMCEELTREFQDSIKEKSPILSSFMLHRSITDIEEIASTLSTILQQKDTSRFPLELARCRYLLQHLKESEALSLQNIL